MRESQGLLYHVSCSCSRVAPRELLAQGIVRHYNLSRGLWKKSFPVASSFLHLRFLKILCKNTRWFIIAMRTILQCTSHLTHQMLALLSLNSTTDEKPTFMIEKQILAVIRLATTNYYQIKKQAKASTATVCSMWQVTCAPTALIACCFAHTS